ncbi:MAG: WG repeat-containing protein [Muribaculaceae bacterium]|nr:WG repeat-containing protein [Muribaculaceae bacterium]
MKSMLKLGTLALCLLAVCSCSKKDKNYPYDVKYMPVMLEGSEKWSILDTESGEVIACDAFVNAPSAIQSEMLAVHNDKGTIDYYNVNDLSKPVNKQSYGSGTRFSADGYAAAALKGGKICVINTDCEVVKELDADVVECSMFDRGMAIIHTTADRFGYVNTDGETVIKADFLHAAPFMNCDVAVVSQETADSVGNVSFIDNKGKVLYSAPATKGIPMIPYFEADALPMQRPDTIVCVDKEGKEIPNPFAKTEALKNADYDDIASTKAHNYIVYKNGKAGVVDSENKVIIPMKFDQLVDISSKRYIARSGEAYFIVDEKGDKVGSAKFTSFITLDDFTATRGYVDIQTMAANIMSLFDANTLGGVRQGMKLNDFYAGLDGEHPEKYIGKNFLVQPMGSNMNVNFFFNGDLATTDNATSLPTLNLDAALRCAALEFNAQPFDNKTEQELIDLISANMGSKGFINEGKGIFVAETGNAIAMGYNKGIFMLYYYMNKNYAQQLPRNERTD